MVTATPAAPAPLITTCRSLSLRLTSFAALRSAAVTTIAVPCWSSWNTGMSIAASSRCSIPKQRGALMSSRLIPPNDGASARTISTMASGSLVSRQIGTASTFANVLNSTALPSITGIAPRGPMSPSPSTAVPSVTTATVFCTQVYSRVSDSSAAIAWDTRATPGVYAMERSSRLASGTVDAIAILPPRCSAKTGSFGSGGWADTTDSKGRGGARVIEMITSPPGMVRPDEEGRAAPGVTRGC